MAAVQSNGDALEYACEELRADRDVVIAAVQSGDNQRALGDACEELQADRDVVTAAVQC